MIRLVHNKRFQQRVFYTLCFFALCLIDWVKGSLNGRAQMVATNLTGIVLAIIIFSAFEFKSFIKPVFAIWLVICIVAVPVCIHTVFSAYPYKGQIITASLNIVVYGFIVIKILSELKRNKKFNGLNIPLFVGWLVMLVLMLFSINENIWPIWYAVVFGSFYMTEFDKNTEQSILRSISDGIILGFFAIQGIALLFRPYDFVRYTGLYINPNFNALFYLMSYSAFLCKWYVLKKESKHSLFRVILCLFSASMYGFCIYTGSKSAILAMLLVTIPFSVLMLRYSKRKALSFLGCWLVLGIVGIISIPIVYGAIRYMPTVHLHPLYFEGEYSTEKIQPGEPRDSEKYISFEYAMDINMGRFFYVLPKLKERAESLWTLKVHAAEPDDFAEPEYIFSDEEANLGINPVRMRQEIYRYYFERLNLVGHTNDYEGAPIDYTYTAPHAHNVFIQMAFLYGIPAGILFVLMVVAFVPGCISLMKADDDFNVCVIACFVIAFAVFGFFEIDWMCGQLPFTMFFLLFRYVVRKIDYKNYHAQII